MVTVIISVTAASYNVGVKIGEVQARLSALEVFANQGDRWTAKNGMETRNRLTALEQELKDLPPDWFEKQQDETRHEVKAMAGRLSRVEQAVHDLMQLIVVHRQESEDARQNR